MTFGIGNTHKDWQRYHDLIMDTEEVMPTEEEIITSTQTHCHQIINGLYLGDSKAFKQTCIDDDFKTVITACPLSIMYQDPFKNFGKPPIPSVDELTHLFKEKKITWYYVGKMMWDNSNYWHGLVHDCTYLDTELAKKELLPDESNFIELSTEKYNVIMHNTHGDKWFEPVFAVLDEAVFEGSQTLVHCHQGVSRSATIIAAYLINRFGITSKQAINYLTCKRFCVNPKFSNALDNYYWLLKHMH